jgi:hypothetical protein
MDKRGVMEIKTSTLGPSWDDFETARMKREDENVARRVADYQRRGGWFDQTEEEL